ncbi:hypothetical protein E3P77_00879 [Wallemia ichthyophaga]|uniref:BZIP domain-containing protein n=2 Tax=Wallemia ichthyophaga TaxID=245174 RepID=A0A4T0GD74_WALIC|nr:uncharacterized protein J056_000562 [Wallemia ichthyophaga EXF-994]TIA74407.1 hypothetical protein E3P91_00926 [Wallemia ichthyophaga]EOR00752.1 hypothetical protein J056_000562 [Wallemia ichthyophaga EXF-994]TIA98176.1 hypothetical protein E3P95_02539 [Wallemia ichthyophaga]TIA99307.1 hypothetical protein E3P94_02598 [Wallemia ichthyophaga]TIB15123.1 hypothetical protein E3P90_00978 [Wallemia ichthyophaga]
MPSSSKPTQVDEEDQRRQQNRLAQREFRQRKQREKDELKARIEFLERDPDQQSQLMTRVARELYAENNRLRALVHSLSSFVGTGAGSSLHGLGLTPAQMDNLLSYSRVEPEVDVGFEMFMQNRSRRGGRGDENDIGNKRPRYSLSNGSDSASPVSHAQRQAQPETHTSAQAQSPAQPHPYALNHLLNDNLSTSHASSTPTQPRTDFQNDCFVMMSSDDPEFNVSTKLNGEETTLYNFASSLKHYSSSKMVQAAQLIEYNLNNFRADQSYHLPPSLKPSLIQRTVPHDSLIDGIPFASLRDKLILNSDSSSSSSSSHEHAQAHASHANHTTDTSKTSQSNPKVDVRRVIRMLLTSTTIHGEDVLNADNWELDDRFYADYFFLTDKHMLDTSNKWRERSHRPLLAGGEMNHLF